MRQGKYHIKVRDSAAKEIRSLPPDIKSRIITAITGLSETPRPRRCIKLKGSNSLYRIRVGDYRIIYDITDDKQLIMITRVRHRSEVYE